MNNKKLSEQCVEYCDVVKKYSGIENKIYEKILEITKLFDWHAYTIDLYYLVDDDLKIHYTGSYMGYSDRDNCTFPLKWLDLDKEEIRKLVKADKERMRKVYEEQKKKEQEQLKQAAEEKERIEYERLKAKYERGSNYGK